MILLRRGLTAITRNRIPLSSTMAKASCQVVRAEIVGGVTTFFAMAYIIFVNPGLLSQTGMNSNCFYILHDFHKKEKYNVGVFGKFV